MIAPIRAEVRVRDVLGSLLPCKGYRDMLEAGLAAYFGVGRVLLTHSGRSALYFLLKALPHSKVYLPAYNCWAVSEAVLYAQKDIEYVDISLENYNMDVDRLRQVLEPGSIVIATHQFGIPCDIAAIMELAAARNCFVLEDNAGAFGAEICGKRTGSFAPAAILSFDYAKTVVSGKGGAILFSDEDLYRRVKVLYEREVRPVGPGRTLQYLLMSLGYALATHKAIYPVTYAMFKQIRGSSRALKEPRLAGNPSYTVDYDERRARLAYANLKRVDDVIDGKRAIAESFLGDAALRERVILPVLPPNARSVLIKLPFRPRGTSRAAFHEECRKRGVDLEYLFPYHYGREPGASPNAEAAAAQALVLPTYSILSGRDLVRLKRVVIDVADRLAGQARHDAAAAVEQRRFLCFNLCYYWLDKAAFLASRDSVALLRSHDELPGSAYHLRFGYKTFLIDLRRTREEIYAAFDATGARYKIKKAVKSGVVVRPAETSAEKRRFYEFYQAFAREPKRKNKILVLQESELDRLRVFYALSAEGEFLGGIGLLAAPSGEYLLYKYSASLHRFCENELMLWEAIQYAKDAGFTYFDMSWMTLTDDKDSDMYRLYQFKRKFGGELVDFYTYVKFRGILRVAAMPFDFALKRFFGNDISRFSLFLKKLRVFK